MEDYLFKTSFKMTYEEYKKLYGVSLRRHWKLYALCVLIPLLTSLPDLLAGKSASTLLACYVVLFGAFIVARFGILPIRYKKTRSINAFENTMYFYDDRFEADTNIAHIKLNYSDLDSVIETKTDFYFYITRRQLLIASKNGCTTGNVDFLRDMAKSVNHPT